MIRFLYLLASLISLPAAAQNLAHPDYIGGYQAWVATRYPDASSHLSSFRLSQAYARNYEVDYWLGTSWCRMPGNEGAGASLLDWGYRFGTMPESERGKFHGELQACQQKQHGTPRLIAIATAPRATSRVQAKIYYVAGQKDGFGLSAPPLRLLQPLPAEEYARRVFTTVDLEQARAATQARLPGARVHAGDRFVIASLSPQHQPRDLENIARRLSHFLAYLEREYGMTLPDAVITVYLVPTPNKLVELAAKVHGIQAHPATLGYAFQNDLSVTGVLTGTGAGTLLHELFHLAVRARFGDIPQFLDEGVASLYETTYLQGEQYVAAPNWRGKALRAAREVGAQVPLAAVITAPWFPDEPVSQPELPQMSVDNQAYVLSVARYFMAWLQLQGKLPEFFAAFRDRPLPQTWIPAERQALEIVEKVMDMPMAATESRFKTWLALAIHAKDGESLPLPSGGIPPKPNGPPIGKEIPPQMPTTIPAPPPGIPITREIPRELVDREEIPK